jgi:hypothetical protein
MDRELAAVVAEVWSEFAAGGRALSVPPDTLEDESDADFWAAVEARAAEA